MTLIMYINGLLPRPLRGQQRTIHSLFLPFKTAQRDIPAILFPNCQQKLCSSIATARSLEGGAGNGMPGSGYDSMEIGEKRYARGHKRQPPTASADATASAGDGSRFVVACIAGIAVNVVIMAITFGQ